MRKLCFSVNLNRLREIKGDIVPVLFTEHQFDLIKRKFSGQTMSQSEKNEFSRSVSKKMKAINVMLIKENDGLFVYGSEYILQERLLLAKQYLKKLNRKFKNKHIIISGSFLYKQKYNDVDVFIVSKYLKDDYKDGEFHINYISESVYSSLFFESLRKLCVSNKKLEYRFIEKASLDKYVAMYQELFNDLHKKQKNTKGLKSVLREFLVYSSFVSKKPIPNSYQLKNQIESVLKIKKSQEAINKIFVSSIVVGFSENMLINAMDEMIKRYKQIMQEYKKHRRYYKEILKIFQEVKFIAS
ncbi:hypothetical protein HOK51_02540 [Candidatus Woesearchaeota archaeon]|jgi:hypothetical protein|nr:hypothetical protein [Candidatus Woesearchaeota archaeon]MBT6518696.1 hypothetical protein [Candidatus Woesearchaeota archaeon]MBT7368382.1 hypothetical protein [Candidatus Woesearchaeota archaeon]